MQLLPSPQLCLRLKKREKERNRYKTEEKASTEKISFRRELLTEEGGNAPMRKNGGNTPN